MRILLILIAIACTLPAWARAQDPPRPRVVRVGYTTFSGSVTASEGQRADWISEVLTRASARSATELGAPIVFSLYLGNPYQTYEWLERGHVDAAIVSPLALAFLEPDFYVPLVDIARRPGITHPVYAFVESPDRELGDPLDELHETFEAILRCVRSAPEETDSSCGRARVPEACESSRKRRVFASSHFAESSLLPVLVSAQSWLAGEATESAERKRFWGELLAAFDFKITPKNRRAPFGGLAHIFRLVRREGVEMPGQAVPDDTLVLRRDWIPVGVESATVSGLSEILRDAAATIPTADGTQIVQHHARRAFEARVSALREDEHLGGRLDAWFLSGQFEFGVQEVVDLLRQDQLNSGRDETALVLPGGGVKAAYQARLLDFLYGSYMLNASGNSPGENVARAPDPSDKWLHIQRVIGTSGGAISGVFAALRPPPERSLRTPALPAEVANRAPERGRYSLSELWADVEEGQVFSPLEAPRWAGAIAIYCVFAGVLVTFSRWHPFATRSAREGRDSDLWLLNALAAAILAFPFVPKCLGATGIDDREVWPDALLFGWLILISYGALSIVRVQDAPRPRIPVTASLPGHVVAISAAVPPLVLVVAAAGGYALDAAHFWELLLIAVAIVLTVLCARRPSRWVHDTHRFAAAIGVAGAVVLVTHLGLVVLALSESFSLLELTVGYWLELFALAFAISLACGALVAAMRAKAMSDPRSDPSGQQLDEPSRSVLETGLRYLCETQAHRVWQGRRATALALLAVLAFGYWNWLVAPGLYRTDLPLDSLRRNLARYGDHGGSVPPTLELQADLILTAATLDPFYGGLRPGDLYFCAPGSGGCPRPTLSERRDRRWIVTDRSSEQLMHLIVASGAAFPVFAPHKARYKNGTYHLIDGGYGHNVPIEAAALSGTQQVLVVHSSPRPSPLELSEGNESLPGRLFHYLRQIPGFLFERSQQLDVQARSEMLVASLAPSGEEDAFPPLTDFRPGVVQQILCHAQGDVTRRIGRVESWGLPGPPYQPGHGATQPYREAIPPGDDD